jgi:hypothetical protein
VVQVYVRQEYLPHVFGGDAAILQSSHKAPEAGRRPGLDERRRIVAEQQKGSYDVLGAHEVQVCGL